MIDPSHGGLQQETGTPMWMTRRSPFQEGGDGSSEDSHLDPQPEEDVGYLISTLAAGLQLGTPRINTFSGDAMPGKTEVSFKQWYNVSRTTTQNQLSQRVLLGC